VRIVNIAAHARNDQADAALFDRSASLLSGSVVDLGQHCTALPPYVRDGEGQLSFPRTPHAVLRAAGRR
jgi:hypothetical protein